MISNEKLNFLMKHILIYSAIMISIACLCAYTFSFETKVVQTEKYTNSSLLFGSNTNYQIYFKDDNKTMTSVNVDNNSFYDIKSGDTIKVEKSIIGVNRIFNNRTKSFVMLQREE